MASLDKIYHSYIDCLNARDWGRLGEFVDERAVHNGRHLGVAGYRSMLEQDYRDIPDLHFNIELLVTNSTHVAAQLMFDCAPRGVFLGLPVNGRRVRFHENVFYAFQEGKIVEVWSLLDRAAIEQQLR